MAPVGTCRDLRLHIQADSKLGDFPTCLVPGRVGGPWVVGMLAWCADGLSLGRVLHQHICQELWTLVDEQSYRLAHHHTRRLSFGRLGWETMHYQAQGLCTDQEKGQGMCGREDC